MVPFLLLLLQPGGVADQVCFNLSNGNIDISAPYMNITDDYYDAMDCKFEGYPCYFECTPNETLSNWTSICFEAHQERPGHKVMYNIAANRNCTLYLCKESIILPLLSNLHSSFSHKKEMLKLIQVREFCVQLFSNNLRVKRTFLDVERQIIHNIMLHVSSFVDTGGSVCYPLRALSLNVIHISDANLSSTENNPRIQIAAPQLLPQNKTFVPHLWLPVDALRAIPQGERVIGLVSYMQHSQFQFEEEEISSMVLRIELLEEKHLRDLNTPIVMTFRISPQIVVTNVTRLQCHYFDENDWLWKTDGCETEIRLNDQTDIICNCNHSTPFAVLLIREPIAEIHWEILSTMSYIGCGLSAFFTAVSLVIYVFSRKSKTDYAMSIHVSLSGALFLLNTVFLLTEWGATVDSDWLCVFLAALMHYFLLCCFTWMAIEALHIYLLLIKVFNINFKHYMVKLSLAGWGIPGLIVAVILGMKDFKQFYGVTQETLADTNQTTAICWITDDSLFYSVNLVYFAVMFLFNSGILLAVAFSICTIKSLSKGKAGGQGLKDPAGFGKSCRSGVTVLGLTCLMGTTWGLAFLGSGYVNYPILYLFCILNSMQGFSIFLWICLSAKKQRKREMEARISSTPVKTQAVTSE